ncbi:hypothetical protein LCGC14_2188650, partial [marine sediment metagenome]
MECIECKKMSRKINKKINVYCLQVEKYHNFALQSGVFVHNCGIDTYNLGKIDIKYKELDKFIRENIPCGFNKHSTPLRISPDFSPIYKVCEITNQNKNDVLRSLGTLGGGNHFIEIDQDPEGNKWLTIHSG